jgi:hypothetical protein
MARQLVALIRHVCSLSWMAAGPHCKHETRNLK